LPQSSPSFLTRSLNFFFAASDVPRGMRARHCFQSSAYDGHSERARVDAAFS